jgi:hypothetical protein
MQSTGGIEIKWPQDRIGRDCFAILAMDITAPFLSDMGLHIRELPTFVATLRSFLEVEPQILTAASGRAEKELWIEAFDQVATGSVGRSALAEFHRWIAETYTYTPADRPNWEGYEMFFFEWSVYMRDGDDHVRCFDDARAVFEAYYSFVLARRIDARIQERRSHLISAWDQRILALGHYSLSEDLEDEDQFDPFAAVSATSDRYAFQLFWEYLLPHLSVAEQQRLWEALGRHYDGKARMQRELVKPNQLTRAVF